MIAPPRTTLSQMITVPGCRVADVAGVAELVGINQDGVEDACQVRQDVECFGHTQFDPGLEYRPAKVGAGDCGMALVRLDCHNRAIQRQGTGDADRAVAADRPDLQDAPRARSPRHLVTDEWSS
jgi:hypothetical protein